MKVCFVGIGSIARRHIRNLADICKNLKISLEIDALRRESSFSFCEELKQVAHVFTDYDNMPDDYDVIFITNPTEYHAKTLLNLHSKSRHFFIEKPVVSLDTEHLLRNFITRSDSVYYVACPLRYHNVIQYLKDNVNPDEVISIRAMCSSYLPDWRPNVDYRETYSAKSSLGGGVSIDLIHEWDYITYLFGFPSCVKMFKGRVSELEIDSDDYSIYIARYNSMIAELHLDYFGRKSIRKIEVYTKKETIVGDLINCTVSFLVSGKVINLNEERDDFQRCELSFFMSLLNNRDASYNNIEHALKVLNLTQGVTC